MKARLAVIALACVASFASAQTPESPLRIVTAPPAAEIKTTIDDQLLEQHIVIEASKDVDVRAIEATQLSGPQKLDLDCKVGDAAPCATAFVIPAMGSKVVHLRTSIGMAGTYTVLVSVVATDVPRRDVVLSVTRTVTPFPLELAATVEKAATSEGQVTIRLPLQEKRGQEALLNLPAVTLSRREPGKAGLEQAKYDAKLRTDAGALVAPWKIEKRNAPVLLVDISGLDGAGEYTGRIRLTSPVSTQVLDVPFSIFVKDGWRWAAFLIGLGALLSFALRTYLKTLRPRLLQQRTAALLIADVEKLRAELKAQVGELQETEADVIARLSERLSRLADQIEVGMAPEADATLNEIDLKLSLVSRWIAARRHAALLSNPPPDLNPNLERIGTFLRAPGAADTASIQALVTSTEDEIRTSLQTELQERADALRETIASSQFLDDDAKSRLAARVGDALKLDGSDRRAAEVQAVELDVTTASANALAQRLRETPEPPFGFDAGSWSKLSSSVLAQLETAKTTDPGKRLAAFKNAYRAYVEGLLQALATEAARRLDAIVRDADPAMTEAVKAQLQERIRAIQGRLDDVKAAAAAGRLDEAAKGVDLATQELRQVRPPAGRPGVSAAPLAVTAAAPIVPGFDFGIAFAGLLTGAGLRKRRLADRSPSALLRLVQQLDLVVFAVALTIAILLGLKLLWFDNATWGTGNDYLVAVLWGLGLHQIANSAFEGVGGLVDKFTK